MPLDDHWQRMVINDCCQQRHEVTTMNEKLGWSVRGETFVDGSHLTDWIKIYQSEVWHWQYDTHELRFAIYRYDGQYWKLYQSRYVEPGDDVYSYGVGGVACRVIEVRYLKKGKSPHSARLREAGDLEWIRTDEFDPALHDIVRTGEASEKYGAPYQAKTGTVV